ncbi:CACTA en-spm transposon protein [Cucumis melo var. makuwa]|uniref:CACTA en-spm transposon protein n=1 Tax=Cucumis melo var. makuwa TaxID=1194695 RepID=A0A5A7TJL5_CUCMM|nr:CACTA en-spm transposon protein [Cucumis melo var. makuwa]
MEDDTLCKTDIDPTIVERLVVRHVTNDFIDDVDKQLFTGTMSPFSSDFIETDAMFLEFANDLDNPVGGSSLVSNNYGRRVQSRLLEMECYVAANGWIMMTIAPDTEKPIFSHTVCFS